MPVSWSCSLPSRLWFLIFIFCLDTNFWSWWASRWCFPVVNKLLCDSSVTQADIQPMTSAARPLVLAEQYTDWCPPLGWWIVLTLSLIKCKKNWGPEKPTQKRFMPKQQMKFQGLQTRKATSSKFFFPKTACNFLFYGIWYLMWNSLMIGVYIFFCSFRAG